MSQLSFFTIMTVSWIAITALGVVHYGAFSTQAIILSGMFAGIASVSIVADMLDRSQ